LCGYMHDYLFLREEKHKTVVSLSVTQSFQCVESFFYRLYCDITWKDFMPNNVLFRIESLNIVIKWKTLKEIIWKWLLNNIYEYNLRRNLYIHSGWIITQKYLDSIEKDGIKNDLIKIYWMDSIEQKFSIWSYLITSQKYFAIKQSVLDIVVNLIGCLLVTADEVNLIISNMLGYEKFVATASIFILLKKHIDLSNMQYIDFLYSIKKVNRGWFEKHESDCLLHLESNVLWMNFNEIFLYALLMWNKVLLDWLIIDKSDIPFLLNHPIVKDSINQRRDEIFLILFWNKKPELKDINTYQLNDIWFNTLLMLLGE
jgi:hypothetical protein